MSTSRSQARTRTALALLAALMVAALAACGSSEATTGDPGGTLAPGAASYEPVTIKFLDPGNQGAFAYVKKQGVLDQELAKVNASIEWVPGPASFTANFDAMNAGAVNASGAAVSPVVGALARGLDFRIFTVSDPANLEQAGIIVPKDSSVRSLSDLEGKRIAVNKAGHGDYIAIKALQKAGIPIDKVERVPLQPPDAAAAFASGKVDAWATFGDFWTSAIQNGAHVITTEADIDSDDVGVTGASAEVLQKNPAAFQILLRAYQDAVRHGHQNPQDLVNVFQSEGPTAISGERLELALADAKVAPIPRVPTQADVQRIANVADLFFDHQVIDKALEAQNVVFDVDAAAQATTAGSTPSR